MIFVIKVSIEISGVDKSELCRWTVCPPTNEIEDCDCSPARLYLNWSLEEIFLFYMHLHIIAVPLASKFFITNDAPWNYS